MFIDALSHAVGNAYILQENGCVSEHYLASTVLIDMVVTVLNPKFQNSFIFREGTYGKQRYATLNKMQFCLGIRVYKPVCLQSY